MRRPPRPEDLFDLRVPTEVALSPDGGRVAFTVKAPNARRDGYREQIWIVPADRSTPARPLTLGIGKDRAPRWSPDGRMLAFISDREQLFVKGEAGDDPARGDIPKEAREQVWLLPMDGGEAWQLTRLPQKVRELRWSPDGRRLCLVSGATAPEREPERDPRTPPKPDTKLIDRLQYMLNAEGYIYEHPPKLWLLELADGSLRRLTSGDGRDEEPAWSPDGTRIAFRSNRHADADLTWRHDIYIVEVAGAAVRRVSGGRGERHFELPAWSPDGRWIAAIGHRFPARGHSRADAWRFRADAGPAGDGGENLTGQSDLELSASVNSDLFGFAPSRLAWSADGRTITFAAPFEGSQELWRVHVDDRQVERLTRDRHYLSRPEAGPLPGGGSRIAAVRVDATTPPDVVVYDIADGAPPAAGTPHRQLTSLMGREWADVELVEPEERWHEVEGRRIQGWFYPARGTGSDRPAPLVVEIHGGPATLYGWSLMWEWQCFVAAGMSVYACNPRGSQGYGQEFMSANFRDWGDGPMADIMAGGDALISDGLVDGGRLGVTGGSYGGYLTSWIVGHTDRFSAAVSCRSVNDLTSQMLSGDIGGPVFGRYNVGANPWEDPELYRLLSPLSYAERIRTPLLIQHAENDLRTPITQGEELFSVLRSLGRPVRLMRVPEESHELTRSGAPFRRVDNIRQIGDWFRHFLVDGARGLPRIRRA
ncbi:MAG: S9 family peptidase [Chloroflexota bacterium]|nr:S9 family peptidase [Chloroflexota bacterium]